MSDELNVCEIYKTLQGESSFAGLPCVMVRMSGCNLSCSWCDTPCARKPEGEYRLEPRQVGEMVSATGCRLVEVTGGEPLIQEGTFRLLQVLCEKDLVVLLETNGTIDISPVDPRVRRIVDVKCPGSGMHEHVLWSNLDLVGMNDEVKFVIADRRDFDFAERAVKDYALTEKTSVIFSCASGRLGPSALAAMILNSTLDVRLGLQLHKIIWPQGEPKNILPEYHHESRTG